MSSAVLLAILSMHYEQMWVNDNISEISLKSICAKLLEISLCIHVGYIVLKNKNKPLSRL